MGRMRAEKDGGFGTGTEGGREAGVPWVVSRREDGEEGVPGLIPGSLQRARTDEATAAGSRSEAEDEDDEDYVPYVPLRQRRQLLVRAGV